ncbi:hypothetical protein HHI36_004013 [Cryptolaemus montrouzieri]|uniref:SHSP domain-containing protein n=1 Tax=Cryptolaemus montrouzieri TaxID=559131 RepID=A0ABD2NQY2_9CUCU
MCSVDDSGSGPCGWNDPNFIVDERHVKITVDVEGYSKKHIKVTTRGNTIDVNAHKEEDKKDEVVTKNFNTSYDIPPGYDILNISARLNDGKLVIVVPVERKHDGVSRNVEIH